jgi:hypothetical protein
MNISNEEEFHQEIPITPIFNICVSLHVFLACIFCQSSPNKQYWLSKILPTQTILMDHKSYLVSLPIQV